jgi:multiple sugar transport system substrate-binding protein
MKPFELNAPLRAGGDAPDPVATGRRRWLHAAAAAGAAAGAGAIAPPVFAQAGFDWRRYAGQSIEVHLVRSPRGELLQKGQKEFEDMTGIKVGSEQVPEQQSGRRP